jgi:hypothetical protein
MLHGFVYIDMYTDSRDVYTDWRNVYTAIPSLFQTPPLGLTSLRINL